MRKVLVLEIVRGAAAVGEPLPIEQIERILAAAQHADNPLRYAYVAGKNAGIDLKRARASAVSQARRDIEREVVAARQAALDEAAIDELNFVLTRLREEGYYNLPQLDVLYKKRVSHVPVSTLMQQYGVSGDVIYQWLHRALRAVSKYASPNLQRWLAQRLYAAKGGALSPIEVADVMQRVASPTEAARILGVSVSTLHRFLRKYGMPFSR